MLVDIQKCVSELYGAYKQRRPIECFAKENIILTHENGYEIQNLVIKKKIEENGETIKGYKIGLTTVESQKVFNTDSPFYGTFTNVNIANGVINLEEDMFEPFVVEMELMFIIDEDLSLTPDEQEILEKTRIAPGLEMPDGRYENWTQNKDLACIFADVGAAGKVVIGKPVKYTSIDKLKDIKATLFFNGEKLDEGYGTAVLGNPINSVLWLIKKLSEQNKNLKKGMVIASGTMTMPKPLTKGIYNVEFSGVGELTLEAK